MWVKNDIVRFFSSQYKQKENSICEHNFIFYIKNFNIYNWESDNIIFIIKKYGIKRLTRSRTIHLERKNIT